MSTAGRVLIVLNALMLLIWLVLAAGVTQLNIEGGRKVEQLTKDFQTAQDELAKVERDVIDYREKATLEQVSKEHDLKVLRTSQSNSERGLSKTLETLTRLQVQVEEYTKVMKRSDETKTQRQDEKTKLEELRAQEEALVKTLQEGNGKLLADLQGLRDKFKQLTDANRSGVDKALNKSGATTRPAARPASFIR